MKAVSCMVHSKRIFLFYICHFKLGTHKIYAGKQNTWNLFFTLPREC